MFSRPPRERERERERDQVSKSVDDGDTCRIICSWDCVEEEEEPKRRRTVRDWTAWRLMGASKTLI